MLDDILLSSADNFSLLATALTGGALLLLAWVWSSSSSSWSSTRSKRSLPYAPCSMMETIKGISGPEAPFITLQWARQINRYSYRLRLPVGGKGAYVVADSELTRAILQDLSTDKPLQLYRSFEGIVGRKIMFTSDNKDSYMKKMRKGTAHAFSSNHISRMNRIAVRHFQKWMTEDLGKDNGGTSFDPAYEMNRITFRVICEAGFEYEDVTDEEYEHFTHHSEIALREFTFKQSINPLRRILWTLLPGVREALASGHENMEFARKVVSAYKKKRTSASSSTNAAKEENTLIKLLVENAGSDEQVAAESLSWLTAGHDTTGYSLSNALVLLSKHPEIQAKLRQELAKASSAGEPLDRVEYFQFFLKEMSRHVPVAAMGSLRVTGKEYTTKDGLVLPAGAVCFLPQYVATHNKGVFGATVDEFDPDRWQNATKSMHDAIHQFSLGPRNCPGQSLAMSEILSSLPMLLAEYEFELEDEGHLDYFLTLKYMNAKVKATKIA